MLLLLVVVVIGGVVVFAIILNVVTIIVSSPLREPASQRGGPGSTMAAAAAWQHRTASSAAQSRRGSAPGQRTPARRRAEGRGRGHIPGRWAGTCAVGRPPGQTGNPSASPLPCLSRGGVCFGNTESSSSNWGGGRGLQPLRHSTLPTTHKALLGAVQDGRGQAGSGQFLFFSFGGGWTGQAGFEIELGLGFGRTLAASQSHCRRWFARNTEKAEISWKKRKLKNWQVRQ